MSKLEAGCSPVELLPAEAKKAATDCFAACSQIKAVDRETILGRLIWLLKIDDCEADQALTLCLSTGERVKGLLDGESKQLSRGPQELTAKLIGLLVDKDSPDFQDKFKMNAVNKALEALKSTVKVFEASLAAMGGQFADNAVLISSKASMMKAKAQINQCAMTILLGKDGIQNAQKGQELRKQLQKLVVAVEAYNLAGEIKIGRNEVMR